MPRLLYVVAGIGVLLVIILILAIAGVGRKEATPNPVTLEFWGIEDDTAVWQKVMDAFQKNHPHITISYQRFPLSTFENTFVNRLAEGKGPDIFLMPDSWIVEHQDKIFALPAASNPLPRPEMSRIFVDDPAIRLLTPEGDLLGLPVFIDSLALFYDKDAFENAGIAQPPRTWDELAQVSRKLTQIAANGDVVRSGLAIGSGKNVEHSLEIASAFIFQQGDPIVSADGRSTDLGSRAEDALEFYGSFADAKSQNFSWTSRMSQSLDAFAEGKALMAIGFSQDMARIRAKNPHLNLGIAALPQPYGSRVSRTTASYSFLTVSRLAKDPSTAWQFIFEAATGELAKVYQKASARPPARRDLISAGGSSQADTIFFKQALIARTWQIPNEQGARRIFEEALDSLGNRGVASAQAVGEISQRLSQLLR